MSISESIRDNFRDIISYQDGMGLSGAKII